MLAANASLIPIFVVVAVVFRILMGFQRQGRRNRQQRRDEWSGDDRPDTSFHSSAPTRSEPPATPPPAAEPAVPPAAAAPDAAPSAGTSPDPQFGPPDFGPPLDFGPTSGTPSS